MALASWSGCDAIYISLRFTSGPQFDCSWHLPTFMGSPNHTQMQHGANLPSTNPDVQGYLCHTVIESVHFEFGFSQTWADGR